MAQFFRRLARASAPFTFSSAFEDQTKSKFGGFRVPYGAIAAVSGGISYYLYFSSSNMVISCFDFMWVSLESFVDEMGRLYFERFYLGIYDSCSSKNWYFGNWGNGIV